MTRITRSGASPCFWTGNGPTQNSRSAVLNAAWSLKNTACRARVPGRGFAGFFGGAPTDPSFDGTPATAGDARRPIGGSVCRRPVRSEVPGEPGASGARRCLEHRAGAVPSHESDTSRGVGGLPRRAARLQARRRKLGARLTDISRLREGAVLRCNECGRVLSAETCDKFEGCSAPATPYQKLVARAFGHRPPEWCGGWMTTPDRFARGLP